MARWIEPTRNGTMGVDGPQVTPKGAHARCHSSTGDRDEKQGTQLDRSDLIGIPVTLLAAGIALLSIVAIYLGPIRGLVFSAPVWGFGLYLAFRRSRESPDIADLGTAPESDRHRVLVVANRGLERAALCEEVCRRAEPGATDVMVLAPVVGLSRLHALTDDLDAESSRAHERIEITLRTLGERGVRAAGHVDHEPDPMSALVDGLREFPADEVLMLPAAEGGWGAGRASRGADPPGGRSARDRGAGSRGLASGGALGARWPLADHEPLLGLRHDLEAVDLGGGPQAG